MFYFHCIQTWCNFFTNCLFSGIFDNNHVAHYDASLAAKTKTKKNHMKNLLLLLADISGGGKFL